MYSASVVSARVFNRSLCQSQQRCNNTATPTSEESSGASCSGESASAAGALSDPKGDLNYYFNPACHRYNCSWRTQQIIPIII